MKSLKPPFTNLKSIVICVGFAGLISISGLIATLLLDGRSKKTPLGISVNASSGYHSVEVKPSDSGVSYSNPVVNARNSGVTSGNPNVTVWVNTGSGVYHCPNTRWYANTKNGKYMTQQEAQSKGYRPAHGSTCG